MKAYDSIAAARVSLDRDLAFYNTERRNQSVDRRTPDSVYYQLAAKLVARPEEALIALYNLRGPFLWSITSSRPLNAMARHMSSSSRWISSPGWRPWCSPLRSGPEREFNRNRIMIR